MASSTAPQSTPHTQLQQPEQKKQKIPVPSPLPSRRGITQIPPELRENVTAALLGTKTAIPGLLNALSASLESQGWSKQVEGYLLDVLRADGGDEKKDAEILEAVVKAASAGRERASRGTEDEMGQEGVPRIGGVVAGERLRVPDEVVDRAIKVLRKDLEGVCVVVDDVDWEGLT